MLGRGMGILQYHCSFLFCFCAGNKNYKVITPQFKKTSIAKLQLILEVPMNGKLVL